MIKFVYPQVFWALFLLLIPIIIHLIKWRRYNKALFTNVAFLQEIELSARKSRRLQELLILSLRLLALFFLILAFANPYLSKNTYHDNPSKLNRIIYLDNSLSLLAMTSQTTLWQKYIQDLKQNIHDNQLYSFLTNNQVYKNIDGKHLKNLLSRLENSIYPTTHSEILQKIKLLLSQESDVSNVILYNSDLQNVYQEKFSTLMFDTLAQYYFSIKNEADLSNISIDTLWKDGNNFQVQFSANKSFLKTPVKVKIDNKTVWSSFLDFKDSLVQKLSFNLSLNNNLNGSIEIVDNGFLWDNHLFFVFPKPVKPKILWIGDTIPSFLRKIYTSDDFVLKNISPNKITQQTLFDYDLIILDGRPLPDIYTPLLQEYLTNYGNILVLAPEKASDFKSTLKNLNLQTAVKLDTNQVYLNKINYKAPLFKDVFTKEVHNFAYPYIKKHFIFSQTGFWLYRLSDVSPFAQVFKHRGKIFVINTPLSINNTNFTEAASLIVPLFYQIGLSQRKTAPLYYILGQKNSINLFHKTKPDEVLHLVNSNLDYIPYQIDLYNKIRFNINEKLDKAGIYRAVYDADTLSSLAFNYNRRENLLKFLKLPDFKNIKRINSVKAWNLTQKKWQEKTSLWKYFLGLASIFLLIEMLLLHYWKR